MNLLNYYFYSIFHPSFKMDVCKEVLTLLSVLQQDIEANKLKSSLPEYELKMYVEFVEAISKVPGAVDFIKNYEGSFTFPFDYYGKMMDEKISQEYEKYPSAGNHSGASYGAMVRNVRFILRQGFYKWTQTFLKNAEE
jgi:hypothetical protein